MKIAVVFPGIGYHKDKPLLYYSKKIAVSHGCEIKDVPYGNFPPGAKGDKDKMKECFEDAWKQCEEILHDVDFSQYTEILFLSKSIGTVIASAYGRKYGLKTKNVYFTSVGEAFPFMEQPGIVFHGTADGWIDTETVLAECKARNLPLHIVENANHSLESGDWKQDLDNLKTIMLTVDRYLSGTD